MYSRHPTWPPGDHAGDGIQRRWGPCGLSGPGGPGPNGFGPPGPPGPSYTLPSVVIADEFVAPYISLQEKSTGTSMDLLFGKITYGNMRAIYVMPNHNTIANGWSFLFAENGMAWNAVDFPIWTQRSDKRLKKNIKSIDSSLDKILQLNPVTYEWISPQFHGENDKPTSGFVAQEFAEVFPEQVIIGSINDQEKDLVPDDDMMCINKNLDPYIIKAIQELYDMVMLQQQEIDSLKIKLTEKSVNV